MARQAVRAAWVDSAAMAESYSPEDTAAQVGAAALVALAAIQA
jgi:hypothetical protein